MSALRKQIHHLQDAGAAEATDLLNIQRNTGGTWRNRKLSLSKIIELVQAGSAALWHVANIDPDNGDGNNNDLHLNATTGDFFLKTGGVWEFQGSLMGPAGPQGDAGDPGAQGARGLTWRGDWAGGAHVVDDVVHRNNALWIAIADNDDEGPPSASWEMLIEGVAGEAGPQGDQGPQGVQGEAGPQGEDGANGADGALWHTGIDSPPSSEIGSNGDFYLNGDTGDVYQKGGGNWILINNIKGPQGDQGPDSPAASQDEAEAGTEAELRAWSPLRVAQAIAALSGGGGSGKLVNYSIRQDTAAASTTSTIPNDDTIPQSGEGAEYATLAYTPNAAGNIILVKVSGWGANNSGGMGVTTALFVNSETSAQAAFYSISAGANLGEAWQLSLKYTAPDTSAITFRLRFGPPANTAYLLRTGGAASLFSTADKITWEIYEFLP
jgi:hypothetical protein